MAVRRTRKLTFKPSGCTDSVDGTNAPPGSMAALADMVPAPNTLGNFVCRPASYLLFDFATQVNYPSPGLISCLLVVGNVAYGMIATSTVAGRDQPFAINLATGGQYPISGLTLTNLPTSPPATGPWTPPIIAQIGSRIVVTHPGFPGGATKFGWLDISGASISTTGDLASGSVTIEAVSSSALLGVQPGMTIAAAGIPTGTTVVSTNPTAGTITMSGAATATVAAAPLTIAGGTPTNPQWGSGDTDVNHLPSVPLGVCLSTAGGACYALGTNGEAFSDPGFACRISNDPNVQFFNSNDGLAVTAVYPLMLSAPLVTTGVVQAVLGFKGTSKIEQITGDPSLSNLAVQALPYATGTASPLSITGCELGTAFISPEGLRIVEFNGTVSQPIGDAGTGITVPFIYSSAPSRVCGAANIHTLRFTAQNGAVMNQPWQEWWYDMGRKIWVGPMSMVPSLIQPWQGVNSQNTFVIAPQGVPAQLWVSDAIPLLSSTYIENGEQMSWAYQPTPLPDGGSVTMFSLSEMALAGSFNGTAASLNITDITGAPQVGTVVPASPLPGRSLWGAAVWGQGAWGAGAVKFQQWPVYFSSQLIYKQFSPRLTGQSSQSVQIGNFYLSYQELRYLLPAPPGLVA